MTGEHAPNDESLDRRTFLKRSTAASVGVGLGLGAQTAGVDAQEEPGVQYYNFVVPDRGIVSRDFVNKFLFVTEFRERIDDVPFSGCFTNTESSVAEQFQRGAAVYDGVLIDATEGFQLFGDADEALEQLRRILDGNVDLPEALEENVGAIVGTHVFVPRTVAPLPKNEGYRGVGGESCDGDFVRLRVHELPDEVVGGSGDGA